MGTNTSSAIFTVYDENNLTPNNVTVAYTDAVKYQEDISIYGNVQNGPLAAQGSPW